MAGRIPTEKDYINEELFQRIQTGDMDAFRELYEASYRPLYAFLLSLTRNADDAQDLVQDTYVQVHKNCHLYEKRGNPLAWMMKISKNLFLMKCRQESRRQLVRFEELTNLLGTDLIKHVENKLLIEAMFSILSEDERNVIIMHDVGGLKFREIADVLEKPMGTVLAKYNRSIKKLKKLLLE